MALLIKRVAEDKKANKLSPLKLIASGVPIPEAAETEVGRCFTADCFTYRDGALGRCIPGTLRAVGIGSASAFELAGELDFKEIVEVHLGMAGSHRRELQKALTAQEKCWGLGQVDLLIRQYQGGENPLGLRTESPNIFFVVNHF